MTQAYPLAWPAGQGRTPAYARRPSKFMHGNSKGPDLIRRQMVEEVRRLGGVDIIISTNIRLRGDGQPYADEMRRKIEDSGVAVYFELKGRATCLACDRWATIPENMRALTLTIEALRGLERWGSSDMVEKAFTGFAALPAPAAASDRDWWDVLEVSIFADLNIIESKYRDLLRIHHPDMGGSADRASELNKAIAEARKARAA